jgi:hypothetical protein
MEKEDFKKNYLKQNLHLELKTMDKLFYSKKLKYNLGDLSPDLSMEKLHYKFELSKEQIYNDKLKKPFKDLFFYSTEVGEKMEDIFLSCFTNFSKKPKGETKYDLLDGTNKIEVKTIRAYSKVGKEDASSIYERSLPYIESKKISNSSFQQVKPSFYDGLLCNVVYQDRIDIYFLNKEDLNKLTFSKTEGDENEMIYLSKQHAKSVDEGHLSWKKIIKYRIGFIKDNLDFEEYSLQDNVKFETNVKKRKINQNKNKLKGPCL